jgi:hypothetical protein
MIVDKTAQYGSAERSKVEKYKLGMEQYRTVTSWKLAA